MIIILIAFLNSKLSATALIGLFLGFKFIIVIFDLSFMILPFHFLGLNALIGAIENFLEFKLNIGPFTDKLYAVLPAGVETRTPSETNFFIISLELFLIDKLAACLLCLKIETSLIAILFCIFFL